MRNLLIVFLPLVIPFKILFISDIHFDPYYSTIVSPMNYCIDYENPSTDPTDFYKFGCDSNINLLHDTFNFVNQLTDVDLVIINGDSAGHSVNTEFASISEKRRLEKLKFVHESVTNLVETYLPGLPILNVIGNNDLMTHYVLPEKSVYIEQVKLFNSLTNTAKTRENYTDLFNSDFAETSQLGFYSYSSGEFKVIIINSHLMCKENTNESYTSEVTTAQLTFLKRELEETKKAIIVSHIPFVSIDLFFADPAFVKDAIAAEVREIVVENEEKIVCLVSSHIHFSLMTAIRTKTRMIPHIHLPPVSPIFYNEPAVSTLVVERGEFRDFSVKSITRGDFKIADA